MKRTTALFGILLVATPAAAAPPSSIIETVSGEWLTSLHLPLPNSWLYGVDQDAPVSIWFDYQWDVSYAHSNGQFSARACRQSYKGTVVCGPDSSGPAPAPFGFGSFFLSTAGITEPDVTSAWDSYYVAYSGEATDTGGYVHTVYPRVLGAAVHYSSEGAAALPTTNAFTVNDAGFGLVGTGSFGRQALRTGLQQDQIYGFNTATPPTVYVDFSTAAEVPVFDWGSEASSLPVYEPVNYANYDIDYDAKVCRQAWSGTTAVCGPDANRHNPVPGTGTYLVPSTAAVASPTNSTHDYYFVDVRGGITNDWTSTMLFDYDGRALLRDWRYEEDGEIYGVSVVHRTSLADFPSGTRKTVYNRQYRSHENRFPVHNDSIYGFRKVALGAFFVDFAVGALGPVSPAPTHAEIAIRLCREAFSGSTVVCAADYTNAAASFTDTVIRAPLSTVGVASVTNSVWDYYFGSYDVTRHFADGRTDTWWNIRHEGYSGYYVQ